VWLANHSALASGFLAVNSRPNVPCQQSPNLTRPAKRKPLGPCGFTAGQLLLRKSIGSYNLKASLLVKLGQFCGVLFIKSSARDQNPLPGITSLVIGDNDLNASAGKTEAGDLSE
jgi:hypothetical protein